MEKLSARVSPQLRMSDQEWKELWKRLKLFTYKKYGWLLKHIRALDLDEIILDAIEDTFFGIRRWPPRDAEGNEKDVKLLFFLCQTIRSKISYLAKQSPKHVSVQDEIPAEQVESLKRSHLYTLQAKEESDEQARYNELGEKLLESVRSDTLLERIVNSLIEDPDLKPKEIAKQLEVSVREIQNAQKRIGRRAKKARVNMVQEKGS
jgi:hypothetical protein